MTEIRDYLFKVYSEEKVDWILKEIDGLVSQYGRSIPSKSHRMDQNDVVLITYGDSIISEGRPPLEVLLTFLNDHLSSLINTVHILPFYPYTSDDGFSVLDYLAVNPELGKWEDITALSEKFKLMFDAVINHISSESAWMKGYLNNDIKYSDFFIEEDVECDWSKVVRPRTSPLFHDFEMSDGRFISLWTTFSRDQIDLNYANPEVLVAIFKVLLIYLSKGAKWLRLDAIGFLWKAPGTPCIHLPQTHFLIKTMRSIVESLSPDVKLITETNVPHNENISYFGNGNDESHMVYNFTLPPLLAYSLLQSDCQVFSSWMKSLELPGSEVCFFNFLASHDGVGLRGIQGLLTSDQIEHLLSSARANGGLISYKSNPDGSQSPYEINCTYLSLLKGEDQGIELGLKRYFMAHALLLSVPGVPAIYIHSLLGSENYLEGVRKTGQNRSINRERLSFGILENELKSTASIRNQVLSKISHMIKVRKNESCFNPFGLFSVVDQQSPVFILDRMDRNTSRFVRCIFNFSCENQAMEIEGKYEDLLTRSKYKDQQIRLSPYQYLWLASG